MGSWCKKKDCSPLKKKTATWFLTRITTYTIADENLINFVFCYPTARSFFYLDSDSSTLSHIHTKSTKISVEKKSLKRIIIYNKDAYNSHWNECL